jgi:hypothetical protein
MYSIDPASIPAHVIQWVKNIHYQLYTILDKVSLALLYIEACPTNQSYVTGLRYSLSQASVTEVDPQTKYCWVLACLIDHFSQYKFMSAAGNLFRTTPITAGNLLISEFEAMHQIFLDTRFNHPPVEAKIDESFGESRYHLCQNKNMMLRICVWMVNHGNPSMLKRPNLRTARSGMYLLLQSVQFFLPLKNPTVMLSISPKTNVPVLKLTRLHVDLQCQASGKNRHHVQKESDNQHCRHR